MWREPSWWAWLFFLGEWAIRLILLAVVPARRTPTAAKTWLLLIFFEPLLGLVLYLLIGRTQLPRWRRKMIARVPEAFAAATGRLARHPDIQHPQLGTELSQAVRLAVNLGHLPILGGNSAEVLVDYDGTLARLAADIDSAADHVHLLFYLFASDATTERVVAALERAARRGVRCRVLVDWLGSRRYLRKLAPRLRGAGVVVREALRAGLSPRRMARLDLRNHRKIAVIDGRVGYTGSQNLVAAVYKQGITYEELVARVTGPVVLELQFVFAADWFVETQEVLEGPEVFPDPVPAGDVPAQALPSGPGYPTSNNQRLLVALIHGARQRVAITTPYFIPDEPLLQALETAVLRGVDVHLIVSQKADQLLVGLAQQSYYGQLLEAGVHVHLYRRNFLHAKHLSVDDRLAVVGTSNVDIRSFLLNAEISLVFYHPGVAARLRAEEERYMADSERLRLKAWRARPLRRVVAQRVARLFSPLL